MRPTIQCWLRLVIDHVTTSLKTATRRHAQQFCFEPVFHTGFSHRWKCCHLVTAQILTYFGGETQTPTVGACRPFGSKVLCASVRPCVLYGLVVQEKCLCVPVKYAPSRERLYIYSVPSAAAARGCGKAAKACWCAARLCCVGGGASGC
jgi:hypothetical protein